ncbi:MAG: carboxypeptidase-like regulatory domain-containing protein [Parabacteroides gordonii]|nr:carboxypeptidase-like regulatory domain-containing protein [Parabacteroides gordonii]
MKLSFFILFVFVCQLFALNTDAQTVVVELKSNKLSIEELFKEIERQTDYLVIYSTSGVRSNFDLSLTKKKAKVSEYLDEALRGHGLKYEFVNNYIILSKTEEAVVQQNRIKIEGTVYDPAGEPIIGANVVEKGTMNGIITDIDGKFFLDVVSGTTLVVSYIGYKTEEVAVGNKRNLSITLKEDSETLEEVVVVGYGTQKKVNLTGAVS